MLVSQAPFPDDPVLVSSEFPVTWKVVYHSREGLPTQQEIALTPSQIVRHLAVYSDKTSGMDIYEVEISYGGQLIRLVNSLIKLCHCS